MGEFNWQKANDNRLQTMIKTALLALMLINNIAYKVSKFYKILNTKSSLYKVATPILSPKKLYKNALHDFRLLCTIAISKSLHNYTKRKTKHYVFMIQSINKGALNV
ncbi:MULTISPECIES: hypothetical protein [unclassified Campylobacter]|uniref:hypothetical protein n=1 Tax=unclassified Campylobacter TaxID=2593542 RepID=UPI003D34C87D